MKKILILISSIILSFSLVGCNRENDAINYQDSVIIPAMIEVDIEDIPESFDQFIEIKDHDAVINISFDFRDVRWEIEGDYSVDIDVDYADGVSKSYSTVLRLSYNENLGLPRIIGVKNRVFGVGTDPVNLLGGIAFTDTDDIVEYGMNGEVDFNTEDVYEVEYYCVDSDENRTSLKAFVIIGEISDDYDNFMRLIYDVSVEEKAALYEYSLLYTLALENTELDSSDYLQTIGFFVTPELFELLLDRELRADEIRSIYNAQDIFKKNLVRLLREKFTMELSEIERDYLDRAYEIFSEYTNSKLPYKPNNPSYVEILLNQDGLISDFDADAIEFYMNISKIYFDINVLRIEAETDFEFTNEVFDRHHRIYFPNNSYYQNDYLNDLYRNGEYQPEDYTQYLLEYELNQYLLSNNHVDILLSDFMEIHRVFKDYYSNTFFWSRNISKNYVSKEMIEVFLERSFTNKEDHLFDVYLELYHDKTSNELMKYIDKFGDEFTNEEIDMIKKTYLFLFGKGYLNYTGIGYDFFDLDYTDEEKDMYFEYFQHIGTMSTFNLLQRDYGISYLDDYYSIDTYTAFWASYLQDENIDNVTYKDPDFDPVNLGWRLWEHLDIMNSVQSTYGHLSQEQSYIFSDLIVQLLDRNMDRDDIKLYFLTNDISLIEEYITSSDSTKSMSVPTEYLELSTQLVKENYLKFVKDSFPFCDSECEELITSIAVESNYAPFLLNYQFVGHYGFFIDDMILPHVTPTLIDDIESLEEMKDEIRNFSENIIYNTEYGEYIHHNFMTVNEEEYQMHLTTYFDYYKSIKSLSFPQFGSPLKLLTLDESSSIELPIDVKEALEYLHLYHRHKYLEIDLGFHDSLMWGMPELIDKQIIIDYINYHKELPATSNGNDNDELYSKYEESIIRVEFINNYDNLSFELYTLYNYAEETNQIDHLVVAQEVLFEQGHTLTNFIIQVQWLYSNTEYVLPWFNELSEDEMESLLIYGEIALRVFAEEQIEILDMFDKTYGAKLHDEIVDFYIEIVKSGSHYQFDVTSIANSLDRELTENELYIHQYLLRCGELYECRFESDVEIMIYLGYFDHDFGIEDILTTREILSTTIFDDIKDSFNPYLSLDTIYRFYSRYLLREHRIDPEYISSWKIGYFENKIDDLFASIESIEGFIPRTQNLRFEIERFFDEDHMIEIGTYFYDETSDFYDNLLVLYMFEEIYEQLEDSYHRIYHSGFDQNYIDTPEMLAPDELLDYISDIISASDFEPIYSHPYVFLDFDEDNILYVYPMNPNDPRNYDLNIHELNLKTTSYITQGYIDSGVSDFANDSWFDRFNEIYTLYFEYYSYSTGDSVEEIMLEIGIELNVDELKFLEHSIEYMPKLYRYENQIIE